MSGSFVLRPTGEGTVTAMTKLNAGIAYWQHLDEAVSQPSSSGDSDPDALTSNGTYTGTFTTSAADASAMDANGTASATVWVRVWTASSVTFDLELLDSAGASLGSSTGLGGGTGYRWVSATTVTGLTKAQVEGMKLRVSGGAGLRYHYVAYIAVDWVDGVSSPNRFKMII